MDSETKEALKRLHQCEGNELSSGWQDHFDCPEIRADIITIAELALAEHPADDDEPIKAEWLMSIGFEKDGSGKEANEWLDLINIEASRKLSLLENLYGLCCYTDADDECTVVKYPRNRGDLRRLCAALGFKLKTA